MPLFSSNLLQLKDFLSHLTSVKGDLSDVTAPPFILAPCSAVEIPSCWASHQSLFLQPSIEEGDPSERVLLVVRNYLASLKGLTGIGTEFEARKPLNPFLGELFLGSWENALPATSVSGGTDAQGRSQSTTYMIAEQVSHHPPVTACCMYNQHYGMSSCGFIRQETSFSPASGVTVDQKGYAIIRDDKHGESHLMTMPTLRIQGLTTGTPYPELGGEAYIASSTGYLTHIDFEGKSKLGLGQKNRVTATIYRPDSSTGGLHGVGDLKKSPGGRNKALWTILGQWTDRLTIKDGDNKKTSDFSVNEVPTSELVVPPLEEQSSYETRRAWQDVFRGIRAGDVNTVNENKGVIEEKQREMREEEAKKKMPWESMFFVQSKEADAEAKKLLKMVPDESIRGFDGSETDGFWQFRGIEQAEKLMKGLRETETRRASKSS